MCVCIHLECCLKHGFHGLCIRLGAKSGTAKNAMLLIILGIWLIAFVAKIKNKTMASVIPEWNPGTLVYISG